MATTVEYSEEDGQHRMLSMVLYQVLQQGKISCADQMYGQWDMLCMKTTPKGSVGPEKMDSDSYQIVIDSCCSFSIAECRKDFIGKMMALNSKLKVLQAQMR